MYNPPPQQQQQQQQHQGYDVGGYGRNNGGMAAAASYQTQQPQQQQQQHQQQQQYGTNPTHQQSYQQQQPLSRRRVPSVESFRSLAQSPHQMGGPLPPSSSTTRYAQSEYAGGIQQQSRYTPSQPPPPPQHRYPYENRQAPYDSRTSRPPSAFNQTSGNPVPAYGGASTFGTSTYNNNGSADLIAPRPDSRVTSYDQHPHYSSSRSTAADLHPTHHTSSRQSNYGPPPSSVAGPHAPALYSSSNYAPSLQQQPLNTYESSPSAHLHRSASVNRHQSHYERPYQASEATNQHHTSSAYRPPSAARTDYDPAYPPPHSYASPYAPNNNSSISNTNVNPQIQPQHPRVYKSRSTMSLKQGAPSTASPLQHQQPAVYTRKGSMEEKQALPESLRMHSKKLETMLVQARPDPSQGGGGDMLNLQGLSVSDPAPQPLIDLCGLTREVAGLVLNRTTSLSMQEWTLLCQKVEMQVHLVQVLEK